MQRLSFGVGPAALGPDTEALRKDFARLLRDTLDMSVRLVTTRSYTQLYDQVTSGEVQVAWLPPAVFVRAHDAYDARLLLSSVHETASSYYGVLFVREDNDAETLEDLRGTAVAWVDGSSCAGYLFPRLAMAEKGIDPHSFFAAEMGAGSHARVVETVAAGSADVGAAYAHDLHADSGETGPERTAAWDHTDVGVPMRVVLRSRPIPNPVICATSDLGEEVGEHVEARLSRMHETKRGRRILAELLQVRRFEPASMKDYEVVRAALNVTHSQHRRRARRGG